MKNITTLFLFILLLLPGLSRSQSLPVGTGILEDYYRRAQLLGKVDSSISFTARPFFPTDPSALRLRSGTTPLRDRYTQGSLHLPVLQSPSPSVPPSPLLPLVQSPQSPPSSTRPSHFLVLLPITLQQQWNSNHPYSLNDGEMIPARGYQTMVSGGFFAKAGFLTVQLRPEFVYAQNPPFDGFGYSKGQPDYVWQGYYDFLNRIDLPERFGNKPYSHLSPGQSSIRLNFGPISTGVSTENMWWGPGIRNSLLMSNTAGGFLHFTLNTLRPIRTRIGSFEGQIIAGRLDNSGFYPDTSATWKARAWYKPKKDDWRYFNGLVISYQPKWVPGLFVGLTRSYMVYESEMGNFPVISPVNKKNTNGGTEISQGGNQLRSLFARWLMPKSHAEAYFEYGRDDLSYNLRDLILEPDYARAYIIGFRKLFMLNEPREEYIQFNAEMTQIEQNTTNKSRSMTYFYGHPWVTQGYTQRGQLLGAGIGPGSDMQNMSITWNRGLKLIGIQLERYVHNNDFHYLYIKDIRANWVDFNVALLGEYDYKQFLFNAKAEYITSLNYEHLYYPLPGSINTFWAPGRNVVDFQLNLGVSYRF
ncbi:MAG: capsule assembly Wzi family protein [Bacteroidetes bacterium]|nr:capsule assembly Wzi family protein [Bacteroidota bacterium]